MSEGQVLYSVLILIYLSDCIIWVGAGSVLLSTSWYGRWRVTRGYHSLGNDSGRISLLHPLPFLNKALLCHWMPIAISPEGICASSFQKSHAVNASARGEALTYEQIAGAKANGRYLLLNGSRFAKCSSEAQAQSIGELIRRLVRMSMREREACIRQYCSSRFRRKDASRRIQQVETFTKRILPICSIFFILLFIITPLAVTFFGLIRLIIPIAAGMICFAIVITLRFSRAHKVLFPHWSESRISHALKMCLCPISAIRAVDILSLNALTDFHPILVARLQDSPDTREFIRTSIFELSHPLQWGIKDSQALGIISWYAAAELTALERYLEREGESIDEYCLPPPQESQSVAYCPRCLCQFTTHWDECPDCPGIELMSFAASRQSEELSTGTHESR